MPRKEDYEKMWEFRFRDKEAKQRFMDKLDDYQHQLKRQLRDRKITNAEAMEQALDTAMTKLSNN